MTPFFWVMTPCFKGHGDSRHPPGLRASSRLFSASRLATRGHAGEAAETPHSCGVRAFVAGSGRAASHRSMLHVAWNQNRFNFQTFPSYVRCVKLETTNRMIFEGGTVSMQHERPKDSRIRTHIYQRGRTLHWSRRAQVGHVFAQVFAEGRPGAGRSDRLGKPSGKGSRKPGICSNTLKGA